ncbi:MAG: hypothetical protein AB1646_26500 [Thermodesulfobacteriota bacterium]
MSDLYFFATNEEQRRWFLSCLSDEANWFVVDAFRSVPRVCSLDEAVSAVVSWQGPGSLTVYVGKRCIHSEPVWHLVNSSWKRELVLLDSLAVHYDPCIEYENVALGEGCVGVLREVQYKEWGIDPRRLFEWCRRLCKVLRAVLIPGVATTYGAQVTGYISKYDTTHLSLGAIDWRKRGGLLTSGGCSPRGSSFDVLLRQPKTGLNRFMGALQALGLYEPRGESIIVLEGAGRNAKTRDRRVPKARRTAAGRKELWEMFAASKGEPVEYKGKTVHQMAVQNVSGRGKVRARFLQAADAPVQGLLVEIEKGTILWNERERKLFGFWSDSVVEGAEPEYKTLSEGSRVKIYNAWREKGSGLVFARCLHAGMLVKETGNRLILRCSDGIGEPDFNDLVAEVEFVKSPAREGGRKRCT